MCRVALGKGWRCLLANDISEKKAAAYKENWGGEELKVQSVGDLSLSDLPGHADLAWASFPCQDLSLAGSGAGLKGARSGTFWMFWELIRGLKTQRRKPRLVVLENVYGALTSHSGQDFDAIAAALAAEGYVFGAMVVDAVHFVPQSRPRLFIVAADASLRFPATVISDVPNPSWHPDAIIRAYNRLPEKIVKSWRWWNMPMPRDRLKTLGDIIESDPVGVKWHSASETTRILGMMTDVNRRKVLMAQRKNQPQVGTIYRRTREGVQRAEVRFDGVSGCLRTPSGGSSRQTIIVVNGPKIKTRLLSPREAARLMGLRDSYILPKKYNDAYMLAGDGLVVPVVAHLARHIIEPIVDAVGGSISRKAA